MSLLLFLLPLHSVQAAPFTPPRPAAFNPAVAYAVASHHQREVQRAVRQLQPRPRPIQPPLPLPPLPLQIHLLPPPPPQVIVPYLFLSGANAAPQRP